MKKAIKYVAVALILLFSLLSCSVKGSDNSVIYIGYNLELTGALAQYGQNCMNGANLAVKHINDSGGINGKMLKVVVLDNRSESSDAALASIKLGETKGINVIIGPTNSNLVKSALSSNNVTPMIIPSATADVLLPDKAVRNNLYRICYTDKVQGEAMAQYAYGIGLKNAAILTESSSDYSRGMSESFKDTFVNLGGAISSHEFYNAGEVDFYNILTKMSNEDFDCIFIPGYYIEAGLIIRQMNELNIDAAVLSGDAFDSPALEDIVGKREYLNDIFFTNHYLPNDIDNQFFETDYINEYGISPSAYAALGYDCIKIFESAIKDQNGMEINNMLENTKDFHGVTGVITIDDSHNAQKEVFVTEISDGKRIKAR